jgi:hypothetical protein
MDFQKLCHVLIYHNYLVAVSGGDWEVMRSKYYFMADGNAADSTAAEVAAKATIDVWVDQVKKKEQE